MKFTYFIAKNYNTINLDDNKKGHPTYKYPVKQDLVECILCASILHTSCIGPV